jgi:hypothetical protein
VLSVPSTSLPPRKAGVCVWHPQQAGTLLTLRAWGHTPHTQTHTREAVTSYRLILDFLKLASA